MEKNIDNSKLRAAVMSDSHGNYKLLERAIQKARFDFQADEIYHLGDILHKGNTYDEERCISLLNPNGEENPVFKSQDIYVVRGDHDNYSLVNTTKISPRSINFLQRAGTEKYFENSGILLIHNLLGNQSGDITAKALEEAFHRFLTIYPAIRIVFYGHTHTPSIYEDFKQQDITQSRALKKNKIYFISPGPLWKKRDTPSFFRLVIYDHKENTVEFKEIQ